MIFTSQTALCVSHVLLAITTHAVNLLMCNISKNEKIEFLKPVEQDYSNEVNHLSSWALRSCKSGRKKSYIICN